MDEVLEGNTKDLGVPVACDLPVGHGEHNVPLPLGVLAEMDGREGRVSFLEPAVKLQE
jgi:muramoyltetrapeptide carboxypeptidase